MSRRVLTDGQRRTLRWWLMLGLIPVALAVLVVSTKLISVNVLSQTAIDRFEGRAYSQGAEAARGLELWNWVEPWKGPFGLGVNLTMAGSLEEGRTEMCPLRSAASSTASLMASVTSRAQSRLSAPIRVVKRHPSSSDAGMSGRYWAATTVASGDADSMAA